MNWFTLQFIRWSSKLIKITIRLRQKSLNWSYQEICLVSNVIICTIWSPGLPDCSLTAHRALLQMEGKRVTEQKQLLCANWMRTQTFKRFNVVVDNFHLSGFQISFYVLSCNYKRIKGFVRVCVSVMWYCNISQWQCSDWFKQPGRQ